MTNPKQPCWGQIVDQHGERVFRVAMRILGSVQDAEDVSQEVFAEVYLLHREQPIQSMTGLLVRLATLRAIDRRRRKRPVEELRDHDGVSPMEPCEEVAWLSASASIIRISASDFSSSDAVL